MNQLLIDIKEVRAEKALVVWGIRKMNRTGSVMEAWELRETCRDVIAGDELACLRPTRHSLLVEAKVAAEELHEHLNRVDAEDDVLGWGRVSIDASLDWIAKLTEAAYSL